jgi:hypothetical protein
LPYGAGYPAAAQQSGVIYQNEWLEGLITEMDFIAIPVKDSDKVSGRLDRNDAGPCVPPEEQRVMFDCTYVHGKSVHNKGAESIRAFEKY